MKPVEPTQDGRERVVFGRNQAEYIPLPATVGPPPQREVTIEFEPSDKEREVLARGGRVQIKLWLFESKFPPIQVNAAFGRPAVTAVETHCELCHSAVRCNVHPDCPACGMLGVPS